MLPSNNKACLCCVLFNNVFNITGLTHIGGFPTRSPSMFDPWKDTKYIALKSEIFIQMLILGIYRLFNLDILVTVGNW